MSHMNPLSVIRLFMLILSNILWLVPITTIWYSFSRTLGSSVTLMLYSSFTSFASVGNTMMDMCCGDEVKGEGYILNLILYSFFRVFPIFDPRVPFHFSLAARIYKKEFSNLHPSPFYLTFYVSNSYGWRVVKGVFRFLETYFKNSTRFYIF